MRFILTFLLVVCLTAVATAEEIQLDFKDTELSDVVQVLSDMTERNIIYDQNLKGKVTIVSPKPVGKEEAYRVLVSALDVAGFSIVNSGSTQKIVARKAAKDLAYAPSESAVGDQIITRILPLKFIDADDLMGGVIGKLLPKTGNIAAYPPSNTLIVTDTASNVSHIEALISHLDIPGSNSQMYVVSLEHAPATEMAKMVSEAFSDGKGPARVKRIGAPTSTEKGFRVFADPRTNSVVVIGSEDDMLAAQQLIDELDRKSAANAAGVKVVYLENADAEKLAAVVEESLKGRDVAASGKKISVTPDKATNAILVSGSQDDYELVKGIVEKLDIKRKQVFVEAMVMELSMDAMQRLGVSLQGAGGAGSNGVVFGTSNLNSGQAGIGDFGTVGNSSVPSVLTQAIQGLMIGGMFNPITVAGPDGVDITVPAFTALMDLSKTDSNVNILSAPRLLTSDNEEAEIVVGSNVPIITGRLTDSGGTGLAQSVTVERKDVALTLRFTPHITEGDLVKLNVHQEISEIAPTTASVGNVNEVGPTLTKRLLKNTVFAEDGKTVALGGLFSTTKTTEITKVPILGDIPILGWLFKSKRDVERKTSLMIFLTPKIIRTGEDMQRITTENMTKIESDMSK